MVQRSSDRSSSSCCGMNEFQLVHALITQTLKASKEAQLDENDNKMALESTTSQSNLRSAIYQIFNSVNSPNRKRGIPRCVKDAISQIRKTQEFPISLSSTPQCEKLSGGSWPPHSNSEPTRPATPPGDIGTIRLSSNVQSKVLQFERQANPTAERICVMCRSHSNVAIFSGSTQESCAEVCPGGTFYRPVNPPSKTSNPKPASLKPGPAPHPPLSGRSLKRTPSERFQKIRRKVQKLMHRGKADDVIPTTSDETTFLESIRIPVAIEGRRRFEGRDCLILRLPDHVLCHIFEMLDTRTLASVKSSCTDFNFIVNNFDIRSTDSGWTKDERYLSDPCKQCRHLFVRGDMSMCRFHPKRYYSDLPYGRSYWMCCFQGSRSAQGCRTGLHDNHWHTSP